MDNQDPKLPLKHVPQIFRDLKGEVICVKYSSEVVYPNLELGMLWKRK